MVKCDICGKHIWFWKDRLEKTHYVNDVMIGFSYIHVDCAPIKVRETIGKYFDTRNNIGDLDKDLAESLK